MVLRILYWAVRISSSEELALRGHRAASPSMILALLLH
jgi:hypothetical protein